MKMNRAEVEKKYINMVWLVLLVMSYKPAACRIFSQLLLQSTVYQLHQHFSSLNANYGKESWSTCGWRSYSKQTTQPKLHFYQAQNTIKKTQKLTNKCNKEVSYITA